jgi:hypothetical protein
MEKSPVTKSALITLILALVAGALCLGVFIYKMQRSGTHDYMILIAGIFIVCFGIVAYTRKR